MERRIRLSLSSQSPTSERLPCPVRVGARFPVVVCLLVVVLRFNCIYVWRISFSSFVAMLHQNLERVPLRDRLWIQSSAPRSTRLCEKRVQVYYLLRTEGFDAHKATLRVCRYWKYRKFPIISRQMAITLNPSGSRGIVDWRNYRYHFTIRIPGVAARPTLQGPVLGVDVSRLPATANFSDTRCMYYLCSVFPYEFSTEQSMTIIVVVTSAPRQPLSTEKEVLTMVLEGFPIRIRTKFVTQA